jgi:succinate dehydrogenase flavin-adding protein (antitoxin of CptAB toxin-antitoxin module)
MLMTNTLLDERERDLLRWRSRRGLVENDLFIEQFFATYGSQLTRRHATGLSALMDLADNDLMDLSCVARNLKDNSIPKKSGKCWRWCASASPVTVPSRLGKLEKEVWK